MQPFAPPIRQCEADGVVRDQTPPLSNKQLCKFGYRGFGELTPLAIRYRTYQAAGRGPRRGILLCPTWQKPSTGKSQLVVRGNLRITPVE